MRWSLKSFHELNTEELFAILQLRIAIFVVEQDCPYQEADELDKESWHLAGFKGDELVCYLRILPAGAHYKEVAIGRVLVKESSRGGQVGRQLMQEGIAQVEGKWGNVSIRIGAQVYLIKFYESLGFVVTGDEYMEDGIPHIEMVKI